MYVYVCGCMCDYDHIFETNQIGKTKFYIMLHIFTFHHWIAIY